MCHLPPAPGMTIGRRSGKDWTCKPGSTRNWSTESCPRAGRWPSASPCAAASRPSATDAIAPPWTSSAMRCKRIFTIPRKPKTSRTGRQKCNTARWTSQGACSIGTTRAEGVFLFNIEPWAALRDLPYPDLLRQDIRAGTTRFASKGDRVEWESETANRKRTER